MIFSPAMHYETKELSSNINSSSSPQGSLRTKLWAEGHRVASFSQMGLFVRDKVEGALAIGPSDQVNLNRGV